MSADYHPSSNPFRRKPSTAIPPESANSLKPRPTSFYQEQLWVQPPVSEPADVRRKIAKKVRVQSPPPPSPIVPYTASTTRGESFSISYQVPAQSMQHGGDMAGAMASGNEVAATFRETPSNPFSKTLATMEHSDGKGLGTSKVTSPGRASMDVDSFKRLLMTGNAGLVKSTSPPPVPVHANPLVLGGGSATDTPSISGQPLFETPQEIHAESTRTSHELSELEDDGHGIMPNTRTTSGRQKPQPPSSRHGRLIRVELRDDGSSSTLNPTSPPSTPGSAALQSIPSPLLSTPSQNDLNKPLPPAPYRASHESDRESIFDKESAGKTPEPPSPTSPVRKKTPPAPPITRRRSQLVADSKLSRSNSGRLSPRVEEEEKGNPEVLDSGRQRSGSGRVPPPPPSRRPVSTRTSSHHLSSPSASTVSLPAPPPTRGSSRKSSSGRPSSVKSLETSTHSKRLSVIPPPPPPRARDSPNAPSSGSSRRPSGEQSRRDIETTRRDSRASSLSVVEPGGEGAPGSHDILADLSALQREIDALRSQS